MYLKNNDITYFDRFGVEHIPKEIKAFINHPSSSALQNKNMILSKCAVCNSKKSKFLNKLEAKGLLSKLGIKTLVSKLPILGEILF